MERHACAGAALKAASESQTLHGTGIYADQLGWWCQRGQWGGIYGSPMERLGMIKNGAQELLADEAGDQEDFEVRGFS